MRGSRKENKRKKRKSKKNKKRDEKTSAYVGKEENSNFIKEDGQWKLKLNEMIIGTYINAGTPRPLQEVRDKAFKWKHVEVLLREPTEAKKLKF